VLEPRGHSTTVLAVDDELVKYDSRMPKPRRMLVSLLACSCLACPAGETTSSRSSDASKSTPEPTEPSPKPTPTLTPQPLPAVELPSALGDCPPLVALPADAPASAQALVPLATALRSASCKLEMFGQSTDEARKTLALPEGMPFELGRRYARFELEASPVLVADLLAALAVSDAKMRFEDGWAPSWDVELKPWGPGVVAFSIAAQDQDTPEHGTVAEIPSGATVSGSVRVVMPPEVLEFAEDPHAAPLLAGALTELARQPALLGEQPEQLLAKLPYLGERYEVHHYSVGLGETQQVGFAIRPNRTELGAADLAAALALEGAAHERIRITDTNPNRLANQGKTPFVWNQLQLEIELDERDSGGLGLHGFSVSEVLILPAPGE
jgi:hypothetical protein